MPDSRYPSMIVLMLAAGLLAWSAWGSQVAAETAPAVEVDAFDAAPFAFPIEETGAPAFGLRWAEPRKIRRVVVEFPPDAVLPDPGRVQVQYWHKIWDGRPERVLGERGAGRVGWDAMDDWSNGQWKQADTRVQVDGSRWTFTFNPTGAKEFEKLDHAGVTYRKTLKLRITAPDGLPRPARLQALTDAVYRKLTVRLHWGRPAASTVRCDGEERLHFEAFNGEVLQARPVRALTAEADNSAILRLPAGGEGAAELDMRMAVNPTGLGGVDSDRTIITVRSQSRPFSFAAEEVARGDRILIDDLGVLVTRADDPVTLEQYREARKEFTGRTVYDRVFDEPEQTLERAWNDMPHKRPMAFVHGLPGNRNAYYQHPNGALGIAGKGRWFKLDASPRDAQRKLWDGSVYNLVLGFPSDDLCGGRSLMNGYLPVLRTWWQDGPVFYEQTTFLDKLDGDLSVVRLDDPTVVFVRVRVVNTSADEAGQAGFSVYAREASSTSSRERLYLKGDRVLADYQGQPRLRLLSDIAGRGELKEDGRAVLWSLKLAPGESHQFHLTVPSVTLTDESEIDALRRRDFDADRKRVVAYWEALTEPGMRITTPEPWINDFHRAHLRHLLVNSYKELDSDRLHAHVGTFVYGAYPNESCMMISDLDRRGYWNEARRCLDSFLHYQGTVQFLGDFSDKEGLFYGAGGHETGHYNKSHGYVMWNMAEHWRNTRDRAWMAEAAPKLVKACDWITRQRQATMTARSDGTRPIEYGFLPAGSLEDIMDFWFWLATNAATVWGFDALADALADFGHPEGDRLLREAKAYHDDVMRGFTESRIITPVVRLRNGTYVPKYPSRLYERGRSHGWLRETLEGSIFLPAYGLIGPGQLEGKWILQDYEDNLYISDLYGYQIPVFDNFWFSRGGFSMQSNLLDGPMPYLHRDEIQHYIRACFNGFASVFYPETRMCAEHALPELGYCGGDFFKSSDEAQWTYWLRLMFVYERDNELHLGRAIPRYWLRQGERIGIERAVTHYGLLSWTMTSDVKAGRITAVVTPPTRNPPETIYVRFRHPESKPIRSVQVNGRPYERFDVEKEWVALPGSLKGEWNIVATYEPNAR